MKKTLGRYELIKSLAQGGMGEVFLAYDPLCQREIALKCIRQDLADNKILQDRFLKEAKLTAKLTHPGIIAIYTIHESPPLYYTMPYIEGNSLRQLLHQAYEDTTHASIYSIPALMPIFRTLCQTVAYAHDMGILHRDIKPENILVGKYGEVILLDWGVSIEMNSSDPHDKVDVIADEQLTRPGKIVGTLASLAPERIAGGAASIQTEVYALGTILYQIVTLELPFHRRSLKESQKRLAQEKLIPPEEKAPYRDVPLRLSKIIQRALDPRPAHRYPTVSALLEELSHYFEGSADWIEERSLSMVKKDDWEFQENVWVSRNLALTSAPEAMGWVHMMISSQTFPENIRIETRIKILPGGAGVGILLNIPESDKRKTPLEGLSLWLSSEKSSFSQLLRNNVEVMKLPHFTLQTGVWHTVVLEKQNEKLYFRIDEGAGCTYISYLPLLGRKVGLLTLDHHFEMESFTISVSSQPLQISCLATPNAFLANKQYKAALEEYRRIGMAFPGHAEGREALFRAGIVLLEQAKQATSATERESLYKKALEEFSRLHPTPGAPYEYLGKSLVYATLEDFSEEIKYLELGLRRYHKHPLKYILEEQLLYRMHESAQLKRRVAYQLILLVIRLIPDRLYHEDTVLLLEQLTAFWESLPFFETAFPSSNEPVEYEKALLIHLSFWLNTPYILEEQWEKGGLEPSLAGDLLYALYEMGAWELGERLCRLSMHLEGREKWLLPLGMPLEEAVLAIEGMGLSDVGVKELRTILFLMHRAIDENKIAYVERLALLCEGKPIGKEQRILLDGALAWAYLKSDETSKAGKIFDRYGIELLNQESTILHPLYGCYLAAVESEELAEIHLSGVIETAFPRSWALLGHEIGGEILKNEHWMVHSFDWERRQLYRQLELYYHCVGNAAKGAHFAALRSSVPKVGD